MAAAADDLCVEEVRHADEAEDHHLLADALEVSVDLLIGHQKPNPTSDNLVSNEEFALVETYRCLGKSDKRMITRMLDLMESKG